MCRIRFVRHALLAAAVSLLAACTEDQPAPQLVHTYAMGARVNIGHIVYQVLEAQWLFHLAFQRHQQRQQ